MSDPTRPPDTTQEPDPPELDLIERAAGRLRLIVGDPDRSTADKRRAIDGLGRALIRLKKSL